MINDETFHLSPLTPHIGAAITGIDLSRDVDPDMISRIYAAWLKHIILVFPGQNLSQEDLLRVTAYFGPVGTLLRPEEFKSSGFDRLLPNVMLISNIRENGQTIGALPDGEMMFHHDMIHAEKPHDATLLYSVEVPDHGGDTLFASGYAAYESLPPEVRTHVEGRMARHHYHYNSTQRGDDRGLQAAGQSAHPVIRTHNETGRKAVYVNRLMTVSIDGLEPADSDRMLEILWEHCERPEFVYQHVWSKGDLIIWDNRCSSHARTDFPSTQRRLMLRTTVEGREVPR